MTLFSVYERPTALPEAPAVVPDRFSWLAALLPPVYLLLHGLWLEVLGFILAALGIAAIAMWLGGAAAFWIYVLLALLLGYEAAALRRGSLRRRGWHHSGELVASAADLAQVEWLRRRAPLP